MRALAILVACALTLNSATAFAQKIELDELLDSLLKQSGFTGTIEDRFIQKLGRTPDPKLADIGRLIFFDKGLGLHRTNSCAGCHSPTRGFGDTQAIARGIGNNGVVGEARTGDRNQRRSPMLTNIGLFPALMWNGRFSSLSGSPFDNSKGFSFPMPEGRDFFPAGDPRFSHLLVAQAHIPFTELPEMAGFGGLNSQQTTPTVVFSRFNSQRSAAPGLSSTAARTLGMQPRSATDRPIDSDNDYKQFDDLKPNDPKDALRILPPAYHGVDSRNSPIRHRVVEMINGIADYRTMFGQVFPSVDDGNPIEFYMIGQALAEFQLTLTFANAPLDHFARGDRSKMSDAEKRGAVIFFGKANCLICHAVAGGSNEMFSDFKSHVAGIPAIAPKFGKGTGSVPFRDKDGVLTTQGRYDMGLFDITASDDDMFKFRTSPLRNLDVQGRYFHNGAFKDLGDAVRFHLDATEWIAKYDPAKAELPADLHNLGDSKPIIDRLAPQLKPGASPTLTEAETNDLITFLKTGLLDPRAKPDALSRLVPKNVPSGVQVDRFE